MEEMVAVTMESKAIPNNMMVTATKRPTGVMGDFISVSYGGYGYQHPPDSVPKTGELVVNSPLEQGDYKSGCQRNQSNEQAGPHGRVLQGGITALNYIQM